MAAGASVAKATPKIVQQQTGDASGVMNRSFTPAAHQFDVGTYTSTGQLGSGRYAIDLTPDASLCTHTGDRMSVSGTATLTRAGGVAVGGLVTGSEPCSAEDSAFGGVDRLGGTPALGDTGVHIAATPTGNG